MDKSNIVTTAQLEAALALTLAFGKHKGQALGDVPEHYVAWLAGEAPAAKRASARGDFKVPDAVRAAAGLVHGRNAEARERQEVLRKVLSGQTQSEGGYVVERLGDLKGLTGHHDLDEALAHLAAEFPASEDGWRGPDPEDDRILIWEVLPTGHRKVVWHFSGWHWNADEFGLPQGKLPGDERSLYDLADQG